METTKGRKYPRQLLTEDEVRGLLAACSRRAPTGIRNRAIITVMYRAGLRLAEALALMPSDLDMAACVINVRCGKGGKQRFVAVDEGGWEVVLRWVDRRCQIGLNGRQPLFCTLKGGSLKRSYLWALLPRLARKAGIEKRVHPHGLRHVYAVELLREGTPVPHIQRVLGHASLDTTAVYLEGLAPEETHAYIRRRRWSPDGPGLPSDPS